MKITLKKILFISLLCFAIKIQAQTVQTSSQEKIANPDCELQLAKKLEFMLDGSFASNKVLIIEMAKLQPCGLDEFDVNFFGNMDVFSSILARLSKQKDVEKMTFQDLHTEIVKFKKADVYKEIREVTLASEKLGETTGNIKNWEQDLVIFENLGASQDVIDRVYNYLKSHPNNKKTYKEILGSLKRG